MRPSTSWEPISKWYSGHLKEDNYHTRVIFPYLSSYIDELVPSKLKLVNIVDLACGNALWAKHLAKERKIQYTGIDISPTLLKEAKETYVAGKYIEADVLKEDFVGQISEKADIVTCILALQNVNKLSALLANAQKILKDGGQFIAVITHPAFRIPKNADWGQEDYPEMAVFRKVYHYLTPLEIEIADRPHRSVHEHTEPNYTFTYHRPIFAYINEFAKAGMPIVKMAELAADKRSEEGNPWARAENYSRAEIPMFMVLVGQKA